MGGEKITEQDGAIIGENNAGVEVAGVNLNEEFAAGAAGGEDLRVADGHDQIDFGFAKFQHFRDGGPFGTETQAAGDINADAGEDFPGARS